jgi:hypothetical protein
MRDRPTNEHWQRAKEEFVQLGKTSDNVRLIPRNYVNWATILVTIAAASQYDFLLTIIGANSSLTTLERILLACGGLLCLRIVGPGLCNIPASIIYSRMTRQVYGKHDRIAYACAGGYDICDWLPFLSYGCLLVIYLLLQSSHPSQYRNALTGPWWFLIEGLAVMIAMSLPAARIIFAVTLSSGAR